MYELKADLNAYLAAAGIHRAGENAQGHH